MNKKTNTKNQLMLLEQASKTVEEFFQEFNQLAFVAGYMATHHDDILIKLLQDAIKTHVVNMVYTQPTLPRGYQA